MNLAALPEELTVVDLVDAADAFGEDRLTGAVIAAQGGDLSSIEVQVHLGQGLHRAKMLVDAPGFEPWLGRWRVVDHLPHRFTLWREMGGWRRRGRRRRHNDLANARGRADGLRNVGAELSLVDERVLDDGVVHVRARHPDRHQQ